MYCACGGQAIVSVESESKVEFVCDKCGKLVEVRLKKTA